MPATLFPMSEYWWFYGVFTAVVVVLLAVDLSLHRKTGTVSLREAALWTGAWIALALAFGLGLYLFTSARFTPEVARQVSLEYLAGYVVEESLSIDNMFVFALVFRYFAVPAPYQHRVLFYGVLGALVFRALFIAAGSALVRFDVVTVIFGVFLIATGLRMGLGKEKEPDAGRSPVVRLARRFFRVTPELRGPDFFARVDGAWHVTPLLVVLLVLETTDVVFALDSVPAVFGVTSEPLIVYTSNVFAVLGLRSLYFLLAGAMERFHALKYGLAGVLVFVGLKMAWLDHASGGEFPIAVSLVVIVSVIALSVFVSLAYPKPHPNARARRAVSAYRLALGAVLLLLATTSLLVAAGPLRGLVPPEAAEHVDPVALLISAACYAICGLLLVRPRQRRDDRAQRLEALGALRPRPPADGHGDRHAR